MRPRLRRFALTVHVTSSVGWVGAVAAFIALAVAVLVTEDVQVVRGAYFAMELTGWAVLVPLSLASLLSGLVQSLGTTWGLFRHWWVLAKLLINLVATAVLLGFMGELGPLVVVAADPRSSTGDLLLLRNPSPLVHAVLALVVLLVAVTLAVFKPWGRTRYGRRKQHEHHTEAATTRERAPAQPELR